MVHCHRRRRLREDHERDEIFGNFMIPEEKKGHRSQIDIHEHEIRKLKFRRSGGEGGFFLGL